MTNSPQEPGDQPDNAASADPPAEHTAIPNADPAYTPAPTPQPAPYAYPSYPAMPPQPMPPAAGKKTGVIVAAVIGLVAGIGIGAGTVAIASSDSSTPTASTRTPPIATTTTTSESAEEDPRSEGAYSMDSVTNACDIVDPTLLHRWGPTTPRIGPENLETRPRWLACDVSFADPSLVDEFATNESGMNFEAEFTEGEATPAYDDWKRRDTDTTGSNLAFGEVTGIGSQGYWFSERADSLMNAVSYTVAVEDSNVSVKVRISLNRGDGEPPVTWEEMDEVAKAEVQLALEGLKK